MSKNEQYKSFRVHPEWSSVPLFKGIIIYYKLSQMRKLAKRRIVKVIAVFTALNLLTSIIYPTTSLALTGGPGQPETSSFTAVGTSEMVDLFSGDFSYNIPLLDVGGYPINLGYKSGITTDQEASVVGLGWNINPGSISRNMRGVPDDFRGDKIISTTKRKNSTTVGLDLQFEPEFLGIPLDKLLKLGVGAGISYNNYRGVGFDVSVNAALNLSKENTTAPAMGTAIGGNLKLSSLDGVSASPYISFSARTDGKVKDDIYTERTTSVSVPFNSRSGVNSITMGYSASEKERIVDEETGAVSANTLNDFGGSQGTLMTFSTPSYTPSSSMQLFNMNAHFSVEPGAEAFFGQFAGRISGFINTQFRLDKGGERVHAAYGYLHAEKASSFSMQDINRMNDAPVSEDKSNLSIINPTYDTYSVMGQGVGGTFRAFRSDVGTVHDPYTYNMGQGFALGGFDLSLGNVSGNGISVEGNTSDGFSGAWFSDNESWNKFRFTPGSNNSAYENYYFKTVSDPVVETDEDFMSNVGGTLPARVKLNGHEKADDKLVLSNGTTQNIGDNKRHTRKIRNSLMTTYIGSEMPLKEGETSSLIHYYEYQTAGTPGEVVERTMPRVSSSRPAHHIAAMEVLRNDGMRYVYDIAAYNKKQREVSFSIGSQGDQSIETGLTHYEPTDATVDNKNGLDHFFQSTEIPGYAHSYLLTGIVSPDYVDRTNDGLTADDFGTYTKFNYLKWSDDFKWRNPYRGAYYNEGIKNDNMDDKASYTYGEKELWYVQSIETRTHVAVFHYSKRNDNHGVADEYCELNELDKGVAQLKLDKISLYSKPEKEFMESIGEVPVPIKEVHFEYDYSLMGGNAALPNYTGAEDSNSKLNDSSKRGGKLTLRKVYFTYQHSYKGKFSPYNFYYAYENRGGAPINNYPYHHKAYDRWGCYKPVPPNVKKIPDSGSDLSTAEWPYVDQNDPELDNYMSAWTLTSIELPSGGLIKIDYESDDYAFVQHKQAMQMMRVVGTTDNPGNFNDLDLSGEPSLYDGSQNLNYLVFKLPEALDASEASEIDRYFEDAKGRKIENLYFRFLMNVKPDVFNPFDPDILNNDKEAAYAFVPGYIQIEDWGLCASQQQNTPSQYAYVKVKSADFGINQKINPISKATWQYLRLHQPHLAYGGSEPEDINSLRGIIESFDALKENLAATISGYGNFMKSKKGGRFFVKDKSWIRAYTPNMSKKGGGLRVKKLVMIDNWKDMVSKHEGRDVSYENEEYGQLYTYETYDDLYGDYISSGVASYEPTIGGDENPWKQPDTFEKERMLAPDDKYYQETPYGEGLFPGPTVGYSKVEVKNIYKSDQLPNNTTVEVNKHRTGKVVHEFYTAKDFPTLVRKTTPDKLVKTPGFGKSILGFAHSSMTASQGFTIELNNMHGVQKAQWVYAEGAEDPISGVEYEYQTSLTSQDFLGNSGVQVSGLPTLTSELTTVDKEGNINQSTYGVDFEMMVDARESQNNSRAINMDGNIVSSVFGPILGLGGMVMPGFSESKSTFRGVTTTKVIQRTGILKKTIAHDLGAQVATENLLFDKETGQVLLTKTVNQFSDEVYSFSYPAHWHYDGMGQAYKNTGITTRDGSVNSMKSYLVSGDELLIKTGNESQRAWVIVEDIEGVETMRVADIHDQDIDMGTNRDYIRIIRSGRRNMPGQSIGTITSLESPVKDGRLLLADPPEQWMQSSYAQSVLNAETIEFGNVWDIFCNCNNEGDVTDDATPELTFNDYTSGHYGNWRPLRSNLYLTTRKQDVLNNNLNIRKDGRYNTFKPFWENKGNGWEKDSTDWTWTSTVTIFSQRGQELENKDRLYRRSGGVYRYSDLLPVGVGNNAYHREIGCDNFEDYHFPYQCQDDHFSFRKQSKNTVRAQAHTGKSSMQVGAGQRVTIQKVVEECEPKEVRDVDEYNGAP